MFKQGNRHIHGAGLAMVLMFVVPSGVHATFPSDNGLIVYHAQTDGGHQLFTMEPDGSDVRQITHIEPRLSADIPGASLPDWSPDGRTIVFNINDCQVAIINADGSDLTEVPAEPGRTAGVDWCENDPSFLPDGRSVVASCAGLCIVNLDGTDRHKITDLCDIDPNVSPDGTRLTCRAGDAPGALLIMNMDGSDPVKLSPPSAIAFKNDWAPDGSAIVFSDEFREGSSAIANVATVAPDGTDLRYLTDEGADGAANLTNYSPDGTSIIYRAVRGDDRAVFIMAADGSDARQITEWEPKDLAPDRMDWGPAPAE